MDSSSLEVAWYNKTYSTRDCPVDTIREARRFLLEREGAVRPRIVQAFEPSFHLADIKVIKTVQYSVCIVHLYSLQLLLPQSNLV